MIKKIKSIALAVAMMGAFSQTPLYGYNGSLYGHGGSEENYQPEETIEIVGRGEAVVKSDRAVFALRLSVMDNSLAYAVKKLDKQVATLKQFWLDQGLKESAIKINTHTINVQDLEYQGHKKPHKYAVHSDIQVVMDRVEHAPLVQERTLAFVEKGFLFSAQHLVYQYTQVEKLHKYLMKKALQDGKNTAQEYARSIGISLDTVPVMIKAGTLACHSVNDNPPPYEKQWHSGNGDLYNKFFVLTKMYYGILDAKEDEGTPEDSKDEKQRELAELSSNPAALAREEDKKEKSQEEFSEKHGEDGKKEQSGKEERERDSEPENREETPEEAPEEENN